MKLVNHTVLSARSWHACVLVFFFTLAGIARAQDINATVAPNAGGSDNSVDIKNTGTTRWYFFSSPTPAGVTMARIDSSGIGVYPWPSPGSFAPDPVSLSQNRIFQGESLRIYPKGAAAGTTILVEFSYTPVGTRYFFRVVVTGGVQVTSLNILDPSPTAAASARWRVMFDAPVSGVTAANFAFTGVVPGASITSVTPDTAEPSASWTITANTGTGNGLLGLNWVGHKTESPNVPNSFVGQFYDFTSYPIITLDPVGGALNRNMSLTMTAAGTVRGLPVNYQWYSGSSQNPGAATAIPGATTSSYTPPLFANVGVYQYFCRAFTTPGFYGDSLTATITVVDPPQITVQPAPAFFVLGQSASFTVAATGTSLKYQWYQGNAPSTANPVGINSATLTTGGLTGDERYWVRVSNPGPAVADSATATATMITLPVVTSNPQAQSVIASQSAEFTALASGLFATVQWQMSDDDGATFTNIPDATSSPLRFTTTLADNGKRYRAQFANAAGATPTTAAILTVTAPSSPILAVAKSTSGGVVQITITNAAQVSFSALTTTDVALPLSEWMDLGPIPEVSPGVYQFTHGGPLQGPRRYYRAKSP